MSEFLKNGFYVVRVDVIAYIYIGLVYHNCKSDLTIFLYTGQGGLLLILFCIGWHPFGLVLEDLNLHGIIFCKGWKQMQIW